MYIFSVALAAFVHLSICSPLLPQQLLSNPTDPASILRIPTVHESAIQARRMLHLGGIGTLSTVFQSPISSPLSSSSSSPSTAPFDILARTQPPKHLEGIPIGLPDYFGDCEPSTGNPTLLAISIATSFRNAAAGSNISLTLRWDPPQEDNTMDTTLATHWPRSPASLPRYALLGHLEDVRGTALEQARLTACFVKRHPDAVTWLPGNRIHESRWMRLVVDAVYWVGGFGDRAYIGWIPVEEWRSVTREEIEQCRLPGE